MDPRTKERVERWESRPFTGGADALATLADNTFSGAVTAAGVWTFMLNGRIVGVADGTVEDVAGASGTIYEAPADPLPLLAAMLEQGGDPRGQYYTNDTSLAEVDRKLQQGSFTGYIELSEQVLSGDYYAVYYGGRRMSAAYIGNAERLLTGDEAFERADDEVGIYEVIDVDVSVTDVPGRGGTDETAEGSEPDDPPATDQAEPDTDHAGRAVTEGAGNAAGVGDVERTPGTGTSDTAAGAGGSEGVADGTDAPPTADRTTMDATESGDATRAGADHATDQPDAAPDPSETEVSYTDADSADSLAADSATADSSRPTTTEPDDRTGITTTEDVVESQSDGITTAADSAEESAAGASESTPTSGGAADADAAGRGTAADDADDDEPDERFREEERWRETRQIPSIDPETSSEESTSNGRSGRTNSQSGQNARKRPTPADVASTEQALRSDMLEREDKIDHLTQRVTELEETRKQLVRERDELASENDELRELVSRLQGRIDELEQRIEQTRSDPAPSTEPMHSAAPTSTPASPEITLTPTQALEQTNIFVRYASKSQPTLEAAHEGEGSRGDLDRNLQLERHTQFDANTAAVDGQPYESFIQESMQFRFVEWLIGTCLFEIRETGHAGDLADLYDVIPRIDRVELAATISLEEDETENVPDQVTFDVAAFDKRGTPLVVANCNNSRDPATQGMLERLEADASSVCANYPNLGAAVVVTSSFFDPGALELAEEVTTSGFLSRNSKVSYVNLSRKQGYHCCLVESRSGGFHLTVPEL